MSYVLYDWPWSPFCHKVRAILEHKNVPYDRVDVFGKGLVDVWRRGSGKVPALIVDDGSLVTDSTTIAYDLEARFPDPPIVPSDPRARAECHLLEDWADESLYFINLYYQWMTPECRPLVVRAFAKFGPTGRLLHPLYQRRIEQQVRGQGTGRKSRAALDADLDRHLSAIEQRVTGTPYLLGDAPMLCDFAWLGQLVYLGRHAIGERALAARPATRAYVDRLVHRFPRSLARSDAKRFGLAGAGRRATEAETAEAGA